MWYLLLVGRNPETGKNGPSGGWETGEWMITVGPHWSELRVVYNNMAAINGLNSWQQYGLLRQNKAVEQVEFYK